MGVKIEESLNNEYFSPCPLLKAACRAGVEELPFLPFLL
jgi:hypothetical protein